MSVGIPTDISIVTSLEKFSLAEFSGEKVRLVYENGHENVLGVWPYLVLKVKIWAQLHKIKYIKKTKLSKYVGNKSCSPFLYSSIKTKKNST